MLNAVELDRPVTLTMPPPTARRGPRILVAVDRSEPASWALESAVRMAERTGGEVALVYVAPRDSGWNWGAEAPDDAEVTLLTTLAAKVPHSIPCLKFLGEGEPGQEIVRAARDWEADFLMIGAHSYGQVRHLFAVGSVADYVIRNAPCPVTTIRQRTARFGRYC